jgi:SAM-dependent methyltransferase
MLPPGALLLDLAAGTGSNVRYLREHLPAGTRFTALDSDDGLLALAAQECATVRFDLREPLDVLPAADAVVCSALLDMVDEGFLRALRELVTRRRLPLLVSLTSDGRLRWELPDPDDAEVLAAWQRHQRADRGFGPSVGGAAVDVLSRLLREAGWVVRTNPSDWHVPAEHEELLELMLGGVARSAAGHHAQPSQVTAWMGRRRDLGGGLTVGHQDLLALPPP